jgi:hypothetical protein
MISITFVSLDAFKKLLGMRETEWHEKPNFYLLSIAAALTGIPTSLVTAPQDLFKTVMQAERSENVEKLVV